MLKGERMELENYFERYKTHPIMFIGTGFSMRYLKGSFSWEELLKEICTNITDNNEVYYDLKAECKDNDIYDFPMLASKISVLLDVEAKKDRNGKFKEVNDEYYSLCEKGVIINRLKIYIAQIFNSYELKEGCSDEITAFKSSCKNISSIVTTNYDTLIEDITKFVPLIGNDIMLKNNYGSIYKIHGCKTDPNSIVITSQDYNLFETKYELIRAQLIAFFIHNPIIFMGYSVNDNNIKEILETIFSYVPANSQLAEEIRNNFLLVEWEQNSTNTIVTDHDITLASGVQIRINKLKTDDYKMIYEYIEKLNIPISALDIRKVKNVVKDIESGGNIAVRFLNNIDDINNSDIVVAIGDTSSFNYKNVKTNDFFKKYFEIIDESNISMIKVIDELIISSSQYFPVKAFGTVFRFEKYDHLLNQQLEKLDNKRIKLSKIDIQSYKSLQEIVDDQTLGATIQKNMIEKSFYDWCFSKEEYEEYLRSNLYEYHNDSYFRGLLCIFDSNNN